MHITSGNHHFFLNSQIPHGIKDSNSNMGATHGNKIPVATDLMEQMHSVVTLDTAFLVCYAAASLQSPQ